MTQYQTDFEEYTVDVAPSDWTERWTATSSDWIVRDAGSSPSTQLLEHTASVDARRTLSWDDVDGDANNDDSEILVKFRTSSAQSPQFYFRLRGSGSAGSETAYNFVVISSGDVLLHKYVSGASSNIASTSFTLATNTWYWARFRVNGSALKGKIWLDGSSEPGAWTLEDTDTAVTGTGWAGLGNFESAGTRDFDFFSIATNGETANGPSTDASDSRVTQSPFLVLTEGDADTRTSQSAFLVLHAEVPPVRVTQSPFLVLAEFDAGVRITQATVLALIDVVPCLTKWAQTWTITRTDGVVFAFTSLDRDLTYRGVLHKACDSLAATATETSAALGSTGSMELQGLISDSSIKDVDLFNGIFDGALVEVWSVPWENVSGEIPFRLLAGTMGNISQGTVGFTAEIITPGATLQQRPLLDVYSPACRYKLGDDRCAFDLDTLEVSGSVTSLPTVNAPNSSRRRIFTDASRTEDDRFYEYGEMTWTSGDNTGLSSEVKDFSGGTFTLWSPSPNKIQVGDAYTVKPGCDKSGTVCTTKFDNFINFGGFEDVPGQDKILQSPDAK